LACSDLNDVITSETDNHRCLTHLCSGRWLR